MIGHANKPAKLVLNSTAANGIQAACEPTILSTASRPVHSSTDAYHCTRRHLGLHQTLRRAQGVTTATLVH